MSDVFEFSLAFGFRAAPIKEQLWEFGVDGVDEKRLKNWQKDADALIRCDRRGLIPESQAQRAYDRLTRSIEKWLSDNGHIELADSVLRGDALDGE